MPTDPDFKFCLHCGQKIPIESTFCPHCGTKQPTEKFTDSRETGPSADPNIASESDAQLETVSTSQPAPETPSTPASEVDMDPTNQSNMVNAFDRAIKAAFTLKGRFSRADYWWFYLDTLLITLVVMGLFTLVFFAKSLTLTPGKYIAFFLIGAVVALLSVFQFTATIRRLHDTNHSGHFLWLSLIPTIGPIILIVLLTQPAVTVNNRFNQPQSPKAWTKKWWPWTILAALTLVFAFSYISMSTMTRAAIISINQTADQSTDKSSTGGNLTLQDSQVQLSQEHTYPITYQNKSWAKSIFAIDKVVVAKTAKPVKLDNSDKQQAFNGVIAVHFKIKAGRDIAAYPTQATLNTNLGQQVNSDMSLSDTFDGDLNKGTSQAGNVYFLLPNLKSAASITSIRLKWDAFYDTNDENDNDFAKNFDTTLKLN
ncbi:DUF805 domain-containing protein [Levilactobacillus huananensis]|uniref:DUF805 domain-containing protein n=1 Tax=Levilactobacillus huananensis TaxID=2486019 RepID=UPI000F7A97B2|nr:DUF805 domain-containing protein [Levilactobacillus huananensis]